MAVVDDTVERRRAIRQKRRDDCESAEDERAVRLVGTGVESDGAVKFGSESSVPRRWTARCGPSSTAETANSGRNRCRADRRGAPGSVHGSDASRPQEQAVDRRRPGVHGTPRGSHARSSAAAELVSKWQQQRSWADAARPDREDQQLGGWAGVCRTQFAGNFTAVTPQSSWPWAHQTALGLRPLRHQRMRPRFDVLVTRVETSDGRRRLDQAGAIAPRSPSSPGDLAAGLVDKPELGRARVRFAHSEGAP